MELKTEKKTLPSRHFNDSQGMIPGESFEAKSGEIYQCVEPIEVGGIRIKQGQQLRLSFKNKKHVFYRIIT